MAPGVGGYPFLPFPSGPSPNGDGMRALRLIQTSSFSILSALAQSKRSGRPRKVKASSLSSESRSSFGRALSVSAGGGAPSRSLKQSFPVKAALTAGGLSLTGDTIAQLRERYRKRQEQEEEISKRKPCCQGKLRKQADRALFLNHDFLRALRMASYGFLLYGPGTHAWYHWLEAVLPQKNVTTLVAKIAANQVLLGPCTLLAVFAWNLAWMGKAKEIPGKYRRDFVPSLVDGWRFWIPASAVNFAVIPLEARVAYMSCCSIFWNFYLSTSIGKEVAGKAKTA